MLKYIFITGSSSGIGLELTKSLAMNGYKVIATVRNSDGLMMLQNLNNKNIIPLILDVTDHAEIVNQFKQINFLIADTGLFALINNAGIVVPGPIGLISPADFNKELQVNVVGVHAVTQAAMNYLMKAQGKIINIGSISGRITTPFLGAYSASKFALRALSEAMRLEFKSVNIDVTYIEAGNIKTPIWQKGISEIDKMLSSTNLSNGQYDHQLKKFILVSQKIAKSASSPNIIIKAILKCLKTKKLKPYYLVGKEAKFLHFINKFVATNTINSLITRLITNA